jgi:hypothetical protein
MSILRLAVVASPSSNDHAVLCLVDGVDVVAQLGGLGLDPDDFFKEPPRATPGEPAREYRIGRCECGVVGCGDVLAQVVRDQDHVTWMAATNEFVFDAAQYDEELARAASDHSWETPHRTAERLVRERVPANQLRERGLVFEWASGRASQGKFTLAIHEAEGPYRQVLLTVPWRDDLEQVVAEALAVLRQQ